ncbi:uncharacterized [Tachysurus ichikawai]
MGCCSGRCTLAFICGMQLIVQGDLITWKRFSKAYSAFAAHWQRAAKKLALVIFAGCKAKSESKSAVICLTVNV